MDPDKEEKRYLEHDKKEERGFWITTRRRGIWTRTRRRSIGSLKRRINYEIQVIIFSIYKLITITYVYFKGR